MIKDGKWKELVGRNIEFAIKRGNLSTDPVSVYQADILTITGWAMVFGEEFRKHLAPVEFPLFQD